MADIYLSYSKWDRAKLAPIVALLEREGWSVWWDTRVGPGEGWDEMLERQADAAACVVVVWSASSLDSTWVRLEARGGLARGILVPVVLEYTEPPHPFSRVAVVNFSDWKGDSEAREARELVAAIKRTAGSPGLWAAASAAGGTPEFEHWQAIKNSRNHADSERYLALHPSGPLSEPARARLSQLQIFDTILTQPVPSASQANLWVLAAALIAIVGASTWSTFFPGAPPGVPQTTTEPPLAETPQPEVKENGGYDPFGQIKQGCPSDEYGCRLAPSCTWLDAFDICVAKSPEAGGPSGEEPKTTETPLPSCPSDELGCRDTPGCVWLDPLSNCVAQVPAPKAETEQQEAPPPTAATDCASIESDLLCGLETECEWFLDQCFRKLSTDQGQ